MAFYPLLEHDTVKRLLEDQENNLGSIPVYEVEIGEGTVSSTFADMPAKKCEAYFIDSEASQGFLVPNEMDNYTRCQLLPADALASDPVFIRNDMPQMDAMIMADQKKRNAQFAYLESKSEDHRLFFERANAFNQLFGDVFDVPASFESYLERLTDAEFGQPAPLCPDPAPFEALAQRYQQATGKHFQPPKVMAHVPKHQESLIKVSAIERSLKEQVFEAENGFKVDAEAVNDLCFTVNVTNPNGKVLESAIFELEPNDASIYGEDFQLGYLDIDCGNNFFRYGKRIDAKDSLLAEVFKDFDYENACFDLGHDAPHSLTDDDLTVYGLDDLKGLSIYNHLASNHPDVAGKFSMMSSATMKHDRQNEHTPTPTPI